ncbi:MFS transporter [Streptomyces sp. NBC_01525]|uniref:MFS transporter n=1 Tax=Streptomyces sp. NBC_01525 TaxID=2903893 RepID=UPI0038657937
MTTETPAEEAAGADRDFAKLWAGQSASLLGDQVMVLGLPLLAVAALDATPAQAALIPMFLFGPFLLLGLPAGAIIERLPRRTVMIGCDALQAACFALIAVLALTDTLSLIGLLALVGVAGCGTVFFQVAYTSYLPVLFTGTKKLHRGNARLFFSESVSRSLGPVIAGPVIAFVGVAAAVALNSLTFALSVLAVLWIRTREPKKPVQEQARERGWLIRDVGEGLRFFLKHPRLEPVILCGTVYVLFLTMVEASLVLYSREELHLGAVGIGLVVGAAAAGFPVGNLLSGRMVERWGMARTLITGASVSVLGLVLMPVSGGLGSIAGLVIGSVIHGVGEGAFGPTSQTLRQTDSPPELLSRVNSVQRFLLWGSIPLGSALASGVIAGFGLSAAVWVGALGTVLCLPVLVRKGIRAQFRGSSHPEDGGGTDAGGDADAALPAQPTAVTQPLDT